MSDDDSISDVIDDIDFDEMENDILNFANEPSVKSYLELGVDLQNYKNQINEELNLAQQASINDYLKQVPYVTALNNQLNKLDDTLASMEERLKIFNESLSKMSGYIYNIQAKSQDITQKLKNRREYESLLGEFTRSVSITPDFIQDVFNTPVGVEYVKIVEQLEQKIRFSTRSEVKETSSSQDFMANLMKLKTKAAENIKNWLSTRTTELIIYPENQPITQENMIRCHKLVYFLREFSPDDETACRANYTDYMSRYYAEIYHSLSRSITRKMSQVPMQLDTLVPQPQSFSFFSRKRNMGENSSFFSLGDRYKVLNNILAPPVDIPEGSYPLEYLMQNFFMNYMNKVTEEHDFIAAFWYDNGMASNVFSAASRVIETFVDELLAKINDPVCVAILHRIVSAHREELSRRHVHCLEQYMNSLERSLNARFRQILLSNIQNLEQTDPKTLSDMGHHANAVARRFSELAASITKLTTKTNEDVLIPAISDCAATFCGLFERSSKKFAAPTGDAFLINNFFVVSNVLRPLGQTTLLQLFDAKHDDACARYVESSISKSFGDLTTVVKSAFESVENNWPPKRTNFGPTILSRIANDFKDRHVSEMKTSADSMLTLFGDFTDGQNIKRNIAKRTVLYWTRFEQLCKVIAEKEPQAMRWVNSMLSIQQLVLNIRPLTESF